MPEALLNVLTILLKGFGKSLPALLAFLAGRDKSKAKIISNSVNDRQAGDAVAVIVNRSIRKKGVAGHVRNSNI